MFADTATAQSASFSVITPKSVGSGEEAEVVYVSYTVTGAIIAESKYRYGGSARCFGVLLRET